MRPVHGILAAGWAIFAGCSSEPPVAALADAGEDASLDGVAPEGDVPDGGAEAHADAGPAIPVTAEILSRQAITEQLLFAAGEMQISGEPFTRDFAGRNLDGYDRYKLPPDMYDPDQDPATANDVLDTFGFSTAVESYEYSKYHMNILATQSGAGVSLAHGPMVAALDADPTAALRTRVQSLLVAAGTDVGAFAQVPAPTDNALNRLGFGGLVPVMIPWSEFDPTAHPDGLVARGCSFDSGYGASATAVIVPDYECGYSSLHLPDLFGQVKSEISPGAVGLFAWKEALWAIDFNSRLHDKDNNFVEKIAAADLPGVGKAGNVVKAADPGAVAGTYLGSSPLEGMWGLVMLDEIDNAAASLLASYMTADGAALGGFATLADALAYDYGSPLRWFPARIAAQIGPPFEFPAAASPTIADASSSASDLAALLLGGAMTFGMTDARNAAVGQAVGLAATFDGDPFPADDGVAGAEATLHDRMLCLLKVAFVDLDRIHAHPKTGVLVDTATVSGSVITRGGRVSTTSLAHSIISLRQLLLSVNGAITQYGGADPSPSADAQGILNGAPLSAPGGLGFSARVRALTAAQGEFVLASLTDDDGAVKNFATVAEDGKVTVDPSPTTLEAQAAAIRALVEVFLLTEDEKYRTRARAVARRLESAFYTEAAGLYRGLDGGPDEVTMSPETFAWLQSALRETYKALPLAGDPGLDRSNIERRIARVDKLFLNGWDDRNRDGKVDTATECLAGRLQLAEQALTGELGKEGAAASADRDGDCVPEVDDAMSLATLAASVRFRAER
jgi:hypothetical protein